MRLSGTCTILGLAVLLTLAFAGSPAVAVNATGAKPVAPGAAAAGKDKKDKKGKDGKDTKDDPSSDDEFPVPTDEPVVVKEFTSREVARVCERYEGHLIAYYGDVYKVEHCRRRAVNDNKTIYSLQRSGNKVLDVDGDVVAALPEGDPVDEATTLKTARSCAQLDGHYITYSNVDVYYVEHCAKRIFPDWTTYSKHREKKGDQKGEILSLSWVEFSHLKDGPPIKSVIDDMFAKLLTGEAGVDIIPVNEACEGIEGHITSYYSRVYKIEKCKKREIVEPDLYLLKLGGKVKVVELKSEQWLSLPDGAPIIEKNGAKPGAKKG